MGEVGIFLKKSIGKFQVSATNASKSVNDTQTSSQAGSSSQVAAAEEQPADDNTQANERVT